jgi:DNA-binding winged helix-turn-helix (wHTH) protein
VLKNTIEEALWKEANSEQEDLEKYIENLGSYLENSVKKRYVEEAYTKKGSLQKEIANINENALWDKTTNRVNNTESNSEKIKAYEDYLDQTALHLHDNEAKEQLEELKKLEFIDTLAGIGVLAVIIIAIIAWIAD